MLARLTRVPLESLLNVRNLLSLAFLVVITVAYIGIVTPLATVPSPGGYRLPFTVEAVIYAVIFVLYFAHFGYRMFRPVKPVEEAEKPPKWHLVGRVTLMPLFFVVVGGLYLTGAMIYSPHLFEAARVAFGVPVVPFAINLHVLFAILLVVTGLALLAFEVGSAVVRKRGWAWLLKGRYPGIKALYWVLAMAVVVQVVTGLLLLGALTPWGPEGSLPFLSLSVEQLVRSIHGPLGALIFGVFVGHVYLRLRPEYKLR